MTRTTTKVRGPLGIAYRLTFDADDVVKRLKRLQANTSLEASRTLNDQRRKSRTLILKELVPASKVIRGKEGTPRQTLFKRILLSSSGTARKSSLLSVALVLVEIMPMRNFARRPGPPLVPGGMPNPPIIPAGATIERGAPDYVNLGEVAYPIRDGVMTRLAREFPSAFLKRMRRQIKKIMG